MIVPVLNTYPGCMLFLALFASNQRGRPGGKSRSYPACASHSSQQIYVRVNLRELLSLTLLEKMSRRLGKIVCRAS